MSEIPERICLYTVAGEHWSDALWSADIESNGKIAEYVLAPEWVSVEEGLPEEGEWVLLVDTGNRLFGMLWWNDKDSIVWKALVMDLDGRANFQTVVNVTHWMPLPAPPEVE